MALLLVHLTATAVLAGLVWVVQLVVYRPSGWSAAARRGRPSTPLTGVR
jgi:hypothetical protein